MSVRLSSQQHRFALAFAVLAALAAQCEPKDDQPVEALLTVETHNIAAGTVGAPYAASLEASGGSGTYSWTARGSLPPGLAISPDSGRVRGTPATAGQYVLTVQVSDGRTTARRAIGLTVGTGASLGITTGALPAATARTPYNHTLMAAGGAPPYGWRVASGALPSGLILDATTGAIIGAPTESGAFSVSVRLEDGVGASAVRSYSMQVNPTPAIATSSLAPATVGRSYAGTLRAIGGSSPHAWIVAGGALPAGLSLNAGTGVIEGTPTAAGLASFTARVADAAGASATRQFTIAVASPLTVARVLLPSLTVERPISLGIPAVGGTQPYHWRLAGGTLPTGLDLDEATGSIVGTPTVSGTFGSTVQVIDADSTVAAKELRLTVVPAPTIVTTSLPAGKVRSAYRQLLRRSGGTAPYTWTITAGALPAGLTLDQASGAISGTPTGAVQSVLTVRVTDAAGAGASRQLSLEIK